MTPEQLESYKKAGKITAEVLQFGKTLIKPGVKLLDVANQIEIKIKELGAEVAFPTNISLNQTAAHYTPIPDDESIFTDELVKLDCGAHVNGFIGDTALTIDLSNNYKELTKASKDALAAAIKVATPGTTLGEVGKEIEAAIKAVDENFNPVRNLSGHEISNYQLHTGVSIPNFNTKDKTVLREDQVIAIEPFATDGIGQIHEKGLPYIFSQVQNRPTRSPAARLILNQIKDLNGLPFATRSLRDIPNFKLAFGLRELEKQQIVRSYPPLVEKTDGFVSQAEHTIIVRDKPIILTKI